jgi:hypothetical protein
MDTTKGTAKFETSFSLNQSVSNLNNTVINSKHADSQRCAILNKTFFEIRSGNIVGKRLSADNDVHITVSPVKTVDASTQSLKISKGHLKKRVSETGNKQNTGTCHFYVADIKVHHLSHQTLFLLQ